MSETMTGPTDVEARAREIFDRIAQIDRILERPARTLIRDIAKACASDSPPELPVWIGAPGFPSLADNSIAQSLGIVTAQRLLKRSRRFPWMKKERTGLAENLERMTSQYVVDSGTLSSEAYFRRCLELLDSKTFGLLNPFTGAQVFRVLMESGEDHAHTGIGCLAFFAMVWPLYRRSEENPLELGARIEPWAPSAYITGKCLLPLIDLQGICARRRKLFRRLADKLERLQEVRFAAAYSTRAAWELCSTLEELRRMLGDMAEISVDRAAFQRASARIGDVLATDLDDEASRSVAHRAAMDAVRAAMEGVRRESARLLKDANEVLHELRREVIDKLYESKIDDLRHTTARFWVPAAERSAAYPVYLKELRNAAHRAVNLCGRILTQLETAATVDLTTDTGRPEAAVLIGAMRTLAKVNGAVERLVKEPVDVLARWCAGIANREIAHASARNVTDFNPAELASAVAVAVRTGRLSTLSQVSDAVEKVLFGAQADGSWRMGHPYYSRDGINVVRAPAADLVWTVTTTISHFPQIRVADEKLFAFVDWLDRTQREVARTHRDPHAPPGEPLAEPPEADLPAVGWTADRLRHEEGIHLPATAYAINTLLAIRDLAEHRMWELCADRFTVVAPGLTLDEMDPVDLAVPHALRLHSRLAGMIRDTATESDRAVYSLVLHGPPGSSKTAVASALSRSMWKGSSRWGSRGERMIRITPADFTRGGEDRVDSEAQFIFKLLERVRGVTILFDEIDDLLRRRTGGIHERTRFLDLVIPAMLNRLQDLRDVCARQEICFLFGTNYVERIEPALMRKGRIDLRVPVTYPDFPSRMAIAERILGKTNRFRLGELDEQDARSRHIADLCQHIAGRTAGWPWTALADSVGRIAAAMTVHPWNLETERANAERVLSEDDPSPSGGIEYLPRLEVDSLELRFELLYQLIAEQQEDARSSVAVRRVIDSLFAQRPNSGQATGESANANRQRALLRSAIAKLPHFRDRVDPAAPLLG